MSDPERWRTWTVTPKDSTPMEVFYDAPHTGKGVGSTGTFDAFVFDDLAFDDSVEWNSRMPELVLKGQTVKVMSSMTDEASRTTIAERPLPDTLEELIQWARMVHAMHGGEHE